MKTGVVMLAALLIPATTQLPPDATNDFLQDADAYAVYAAVLPDEWPVRIAKATEVVFAPTTSVYPFRDCTLSGKPLETTWRSTLEDFNRQNAKPKRLVQGFPMSPSYVLASDDDVAVARSSWERFYQRYPHSGGYVTVSAPGFDEGKTRAMVYIGHLCGLLCGGGTYHFLEKRDGRWLQVKPEILSCWWAS